MVHTNTVENDLDKLLVNDSGHNDGIYLFGKWVPRGWFFERGHMNRHH